MSLDLPTRFAPLRNARTAYSVYGEGSPILLIHGTEGTRHSLAALETSLAGSMAVIGYDQRACGETESTTPAAGLSDLVEDAVQLLDALGLDRVAALGVSFGGRIAQALAILHPHRVTHLVLCNTWPLDIALDAAIPDRLAWLGRLRLGLPATAAELAAAYYGAEHVSHHPELTARFAVAPIPGPRTLLARAACNLSSGRIVVPTLLVLGTEDAVIPLWLSRSLVRQIPGAVQIEIVGGQHALAAQCPLQVAEAAKRFIGGTAR